MIAKRNFYRYVSPAIVLLSFLTISARANFIASVVKTGNSMNPAPTIAPDPLENGALAFNDRSYLWQNVPEILAGAQYVLTSNSDKNTTQYNLTITMAQHATLSVIIDNRIGTPNGGLNVDPIFPSWMDWVSDLGFTDTGVDIGIDETGDGNVNSYFSIFDLPVEAGDVIVLGMQNYNNVHNYSVAARTRTIAHNPDPSDGAHIETTYKMLKWQAGDFAASHDVYFGTDMEDVEAGAPDTSQGNQTNTYFVVGFEGFLLPDGLVPGVTYYWRVDEVESDGVTRYEGPVWSFLLPIPSQIATNPFPSDGRRFAGVEPILTWTPGHEARLHYVHFGDDFDTVANASIEAGELFGPNSYEPGILEYNKTYYWRVDEVDKDEAKYKGDVWKFETGPEIVVYDSSLVGWWKMDQAASDIAVDWSGNGHHGVFHGDPQWVADRWGGGLELDGDGDYVDVGSVGIAGTSSRTIAGWVKANRTDIPQDTTVFGFADLGNGKGLWEVDVDDKGLYSFHMGNIPPWSRWSEIPVDTQWHHFAWTWDGINEGCAYVDGECTGCAYGGGFWTTDYVRIGTGVTYSITSCFPGIVDDIRVYKRALTAEEIKEITIPCAVDFEDFAVLAGQWLQTGEGLSGDLDDDQDVDCDDLRKLADYWLDSCCSPMPWPLR